MTATITPPTQRRAEPTTSVARLCQMVLAIGVSSMRSQRPFYRVGWAGFAFFAIKGFAWIVLAVTAGLLAGR